MDRGEVEKRIDRRWTEAGHSEKMRKEDRQRMYRR
jgi:hypothetical protein